MATYTTNYNLEKPAQTDIYNVDVFNANADKIDAGLTDKAEKTMLAPVETTNSASRSYAKGEYFVYNNVLCCATTAIAAGGTIAIGTNCSTAPVGGELKSLRDALSQVGGSSRSSGTQKSLTASVETEVASVLCEVSGKYIIHFSANLAEVNAGLRVYINSSVFIKSFSTAKTKSLFGYTNLSAGDIVKASIVPDNNMTYYADGQGNELLIILIQET